MVNICGKCKHRIRSETTQDGDYHHYCEKADELYGTEPKNDFEPDSAEPSKNITPTLKVKFNDTACQYYEKRRH